MALNFAETDKVESIDKGFQQVPQFLKYPLFCYATSIIKISRERVTLVSYKCLKISFLQTLPGSDEFMAVN